MKVGLIISNNVWFCPYVKIYTNFFDNSKVSYEIISWNRDGTENEVNQFNKRQNGRASLFNYIAFTRYVISVIRKNKYDKLIVLCPVMTIFLCLFLRLYYNKKYIVDYRDLSIDQTFVGKYIFKYALNHSEHIIISSPGFIKFLPAGFEYILSHNINIERAKQVLRENPLPKAHSDFIDVLTIGGIRDYESNVQVLNSLGDKAGFNLRFVGHGIASDLLRQESINKKYKNVEFVGYYKKEEEEKYILDATFLNIFYPRRASHDTALSNRFYHSLILRKPMITTKNTVQGDFTQQYGLGLSLDNCDNLAQKLKDYLLSESYSNFAQNANVLLRQIVNDYDRFQNVLMAFISVL